MAKLYFRYGAMGSSKTANAIMVQYNYYERGQNALMLKPRLDNRDGERIVGSRSGLSAPCRYVEELDAIDPSAYDCIIVDEAQFLTKAQVQRLVSIVDSCTYSASSISSTPGCTVTVRFSSSSSKIRFIPVVSSIMPPCTATDAPTRPVPDPRTTTGILFAFA